MRYSGFMIERSFNEKAINGLYLSNQAARTILKELASMPRQDETLIETLEKKLSKSHSEITRREIVSLFKALDEYGAGEFVPGRRGHPSRFRWEVDSIRLASGDAVSSPRQSEQHLAPSFAAAESLLLITHRYQLRPDMVISLSLPADISQTEAYRLAQFVNSLPFNVTPASTQ
jgi:hypothetical protein